ncbi:MAG: DNA helicase UvrD [Lachnospiraceae bacterium]|nr:DNA helicase UvrD [Lachnospiraceae bacterium]
MGFWKKIFGKEKNIEVTNIQICISEEYKNILQLREVLDNLFAGTHYVARSEYVSLVRNYEEVVKFVRTLSSNNLLSDFCRNNGAAEELIKTTIQQYEDIDNQIEQYNNKFIAEKMIEEKKYLDNILKDVDPDIMLDEDQRQVVLSDEDYTLVIAGAGAGKTTTVAAKVRYLVDKKNVDPSEILVISFTNKAVNELKEKINKDLGIDCPIATFHSTGNAILHKQSSQNLNIVDDHKLYMCIVDYLKNTILHNPKVVDNLVLFFASYFDAPFNGSELNDFFQSISKTGYATLRSDLNEIKEEIIDKRSKKCVTIQNELLRSHQEVEIANYLYLNNIDYKYETVYPYNLEGSRKPYTPDFLISQGDRNAYIEHFGITEEGENFLYSEDQLETYKKVVKYKVQFHRTHGTKLLYTFSAYKDKRTLIEHLKEELENSGFVLNPRSSQEVLQKIISTEENKYIRKLVFLICRFINNFKTNGYTAEDFDRMYRSTENVRSRLFLSICKECFLQYERWLEENKAIDFQDMINESARILREAKENQIDLGFKYIIVDEYQDISRQRFDLTKALSEATKAKIIAVGDDWQSIYAFSGSDITLFTQFEAKMGYAKLLKIVKTYRNSQEVIDIAGNFVQKNTSQLRKRLLSPKNIIDPVIIYTYDSAWKKADEDNRSGANYAIAHAVEVALEQILEYGNREGKTQIGNILLLGRFGFDGDKLEKSGLFEYVTKTGKIRSVKYPKLDITFMTAHSSKGLGYDNVIVVNGRNETYGFPSKIEDDPVLSFVIKEDHSIDYAEERRLFYVAMTRTKNRVYFIAPEKNPSEFLLELKHDYKNVVLRGEWSEEEPIQLGKKSCPLCGFPLQLRYKKAYGLKLYMCTNEPELCSFMTNDISGGKMSIMQCDKCQDGYLIIKKTGKDDRFLGCTNYDTRGTGCKNSISKIQYYKLMKYDWLEEALHEEIKDVVFESPKVKVEREQRYPEIDKRQISTKKSKYDLQSMNEQIYTILSCLNHISEKNFYGTTVLIDVLRGAKQEKIEKANLNFVVEYGKLSKVKREYIKYVIEWLIEKQFILQTKGKYPVLHPTYNGLHYSETMTDTLLRQIIQELERHENL